MIVYEAFRPSGNEAPPCVVGLFTGDVDSIHEFAALSGGYPCQSGHIQVYPREVHHMDRAKLDAWKAAKQKVTEGSRELAEILDAS